MKYLFLLLTTGFLFAQADSVETDTIDSENNTELINNAAENVREALQELESDSTEVQESESDSLQTNVIDYSTPSTSLSRTGTVTRQVDIASNSDCLVALDDGTLVLENCYEWINETLNGNYTVGYVRAIDVVTGKENYAQIAVLIPAR